MNAVLLSDGVTDTARARTVFIVFGAAAVALGIFAAFGSDAWLATMGMVLACVVIALTVSLPLVVLILAALMPLQFFFEIPGSSFTLRGAVIILLVAVLRVLMERANARKLTRWGVWVFPAALFLFAASAAVFDADNKYSAVKGIYDWLTIFATAFVVSEVAQTASLRRKIVIVLIAAGVVEATLGLFEYVLGSDIVLGMVRSPYAEFLFQPNLLKERLVDLTFNWIFFDRVTPFGTFINAIDYAVFLAAILSLVLSLLLVWRSRRQAIALLLCGLVIGSALVLSLKGSGLIAIASGVAVVALLQGLRYPSRTAVLVLIGLVFVIVVAMPFADLIVQRITFVIEREQGQTGTVGRLDIWANLIRYFAHRPLVGYGLNNSIYLTEPTRIIRSGVAGLNLTSPENAYLALLIETGAIGFIGLMSLFVVALARGYHNARLSREPATPIGIVAAIAALLAGNLTEVGFTAEQNGMLLGILLGLVFAKWNSEMRRQGEA